ncbi:hypothetical protein KIN20_020215 [Parelaphostrongylus tenuis]|uniref:Uncharacterized protein n=1 Tax=Parelaphostrongylus tenuis TaxID=148309 RepID=A0AAD5MM44_PARTN|nr:hypothetical protein KIN20_020215 [Parelaphostrongylus tenuis]
MESATLLFVGFWEDTVVDNIDEEYDRLVEYLHVSAMKAERYPQCNSALKRNCAVQMRERTVFHRFPDIFVREGRAET